MSLALAAQHLASTGRNNDTELVHMSKPEVAGLQKLAQAHGGTLTRNPHTGLVEAGFLDSILPMIAGAGISAFSGGAIDPITAAGLVGGVTGLATGSVQQGLMAGLGAYGGAGLGAGLASSGASTLANAGISAAPAAVADTSVAGLEALDSAAASGSSLAVPTTAPSMLNNFNDAAYQTQLASSPGANMMQGVKNLGSPGGLSSLSTQMGGNTNALKYAGAAAAPMISSAMSPKMPGHTAATDLQNTVRPWNYNLSPANPAGTPGSTSVPYFNQSFTAGTPYVAAYAAGGTTHGTNGISDLGSYSDGGQLLQGPGDGVSDSIPAKIGEHQPARLAEGEFVVPARLVSELGNGSTNAGAKKLYQMLDRIQSGRSKTTGGKSAYAKDSNADKHLPA